MKTRKTTLALLLAAVLGLTLAGCGTQSSPASAPAPAVPASAPAAPVSVSAAPVPAAPAPEAAKPVLLAVSFGTSYNDNRELSIGAIEQSLQEAYPEYELRRAFTSQIIIDKLAERDKLHVDNVAAAMERLVRDGVKRVVVQPTHVMNGFEYDDVVREASAYAAEFESLKFSAPLLKNDADYEKLIAALTEATKAYDIDGNAIVLMGHGTEHSANAAYAKLQTCFAEAGHARYYVGTVEAEPSLVDVLDAVTASGAKKVVLLPLMIVAGDHANNDMAGDEPDSWKSAFVGKGFAVECILKGLGEYAGVRELIVAHAGEAIAAPDPLTAKQLKAGVYPITARSDSSMFRITAAALTVADDAMSVCLTLSGTGYTKLYPGTGAEAAAAQTGVVDFVADKEGAYTFTLPLKTLDTETKVAAFSAKKGTWYERTLVFEGAALPAEARIAQ